ncbi:hypothetical protein LCGC14_0284270 [marine sediment metagenome]|uniref:Peptidase S49 domain-containing protein n=1 Tax=marine sediment metagenome TaxID=412755 RepID=A0A0F9UC18_9ZZZZ|nr:signal peptide peptidase SppA [Phycisphaerae bacterium]HDZ43932.1 signal peptide peptidase SppA [Phycisphaerae bacterium]
MSLRQSLFLPFTAVSCLVVVLAAVSTSLLIADGPTTGPQLPTTEPATQPTTAPAATAPGFTPAPPAVNIAHIRLAGRIYASPPDVELFGLSHRHTLEEWLRRLAKARNAKNIHAVALEIDRPAMGWAQAQELAEAVRRLNAVKPVYAYLPSGGTSSYLVASAAGDVSLEPTGRLMIVGLNAEMMFFRGALDWLGIEPQFIQIGRFKGAAEPMTHTQPSDEAARELDELLDGLYGQLCGQIASQRSLEVDAVKAAIDEGPFSAPEAERLGLIDHQLSRHMWRHIVEVAAMGAAAEGAKDVNVRWVADYGADRSAALDLSNPLALFGSLAASSRRKPVRDPTIAILHVDGVIGLGSSGRAMFGEQMAGARTLVRLLNRLRENSRIKAIVLRINSPGGSALASELIYQAVRRCAEKKPVIASVSGMAASGGYYVAVGAPTIVADNAAIIGSIGVVSGKLAVTGTLEKIGITTYEASRGKNAGLMAMRPWTEREIAIIRADAQEIYDIFVERVSASRGDKIADIDAVAQGRIFTAPRAVELGLVDRTGTLNDAVMLARKAADLTRCHYITLPRPKTILDLLMGTEDVSIRTPVSQEMQLLQNILARHPGAAYLINMAQLMAEEPILTAMPMHISIR